jgi:hypothetical protein
MHPPKRTVTLLIDDQHQQVQSSADQLYSPNKVIQPNIQEMTSDRFLSKRKT